MKLSSLIKEHKFDWVNPSITDDLFPEPAEIGTDFKIFHFNRYISSEDAIKEMKKEGYRPANSHELLSWKDWNGKYWVVALGSVVEVDFGRCVLSLYRVGSERSLSLCPWGGVWISGCSLLAVRNGSQKLGNLEDGHLGSLTLESRVKRIEDWIAGFTNNK